MAANALTIFSENRRALVEYAAGIVGSRTQAEDLVQEAWVRFDKAAGRQLLNEPLGYLYRIVRNLALDGKRRLDVEKRIFKGAAGEAIATHPDARPLAEAIAVYKDDLRLLNEALQELPKRTRIAFEMHRLKGCKLHEIAAVLDISVTAAQILVMDGLQHCKHRLGWR